MIIKNQERNKQKSKIDVERDLIHSIATPLTNVLLILEELCCQNKPNSGMLELAQEELVKTVYLLNGRETQSWKCQKFDPVISIEKLLATYQKPYHLNCYFQKPFKQLSFFGSQVHFEEIVLNLLNNAAEAYGRNMTNREIYIVLFPAMSGLNLLVGDNGQGIYWWQKLILKFKNISFKKYKSGIGLRKTSFLLKEEFSGWLKFLTIPAHGTLFAAYFPTK